MALFVDLVALSNGLHGSVQMDSVALFSWIGWLRHRGILNSVSINKVFHSEAKKSKMTLDSFYTYFSDFYTLSRFQKKIMKAYKKMIYLENYVLLKIFFD